MRFVVLVLSFLYSVFWGNFTYAKIPEKEILEVFNRRLNDLANPEAFKEFYSKNTKQFPPPATENPSAFAEKEELKVDGETYTLNIAYRQIAFKSKNSDFLKSLWAEPKLFQKIYKLDSDASVNDPESTKDKFKARIYKKLPAIADQDYTLEYTTTHSGHFTFIRAKLVKDEEGFALRDNLKVLEETNDGLIIREISYLYPLKWYVRALGPTARSTMKSELNKVSMTEKCLTEENTNFPPSDEIIKKCTEN